jgi:hypothetical protein
LGLRFERVIGTALFVVIFIAVLSVPSFVWAQQNDAISAAQSKIVQCYDAAKAAESAGANISQLTLTLNDAGLLLSNAQLAYSKGDFSLALSLAVQSQNELANFVSDANALQTSASQSRTFDFLLNVVGSVLGTVAVLVGSFVVWRFLKRKYGINGAHKGESDSI